MSARGPQNALLTLALWLGLCPSWAMATDAVDIRFSGFATLALTHNDSDDMGFRSTAGQDLAIRGDDLEYRNDSRVGLQWNLTWSPTFDAAAQFVLDDAARIHETDYLDWAFLRYRPQDGSDIRVGRLGLDVFMLSDYRQAGYTYPWVRPPVDFYGLIAVYSMDGIDLQQRFDMADGALYAKLFAGRSHYHVPDRGDGQRIELNPSLGFTLLYEHDPWRFRLSHTRLKIRSEVDTVVLADALTQLSPLWPEAEALAAELLVEGSRFSYSAVGAGYDDNVWSILTEYAQVHGTRDTVPNGRHAYISVARHWGAWTAFMLLGKAEPKHEPANITLPPTLPPALLPVAMELRDATVYVLNRSRMDQDSIGFGVRWDFTSRMALKMQWDRFRVQESGGGLWHPDHDEPGTARIISLSLDLLF